MTHTESNVKAGRIMVIDDEVELMTAICEMLAGQGFDASGFRSGAEALKVLRNQEFDLLLTDLMMPGMNGIEVIRAGLEMDPNLVAIIMTGHGTVQTAVEAMKTGAFDYILKPFKVNTLLPLLTRAMQVRNLRTENMQLKETVSIHELGKTITFSYDLNLVLNKVADAALQQCSADEVSIMLPTRDGRELYVAGARGGHQGKLGVRVPIDQGIAGWVACNREFVILSGEVHDPRMSPMKPRNDIYTAVSMPMVSGGNLVGVLNVNITRSHRHFTLGQVKALGILVNIIAPILENTSLYMQVREAEEKYRSIFENAVEGIYQRSVEGRFISANPALARILGYDSPEEIMANVTDMGRICASPDDAAETARSIGIQGKMAGNEYPVYRKDGSRIWISDNAHIVYDRDGKIRYYEGTLEDITERKVSESRLNLAKEILEALNRTNEIVNLLGDILGLLKEHMAVEAVGIRLQEGEDYPCFVANGFPAHFLEAETRLGAYDDAGKIVRDARGNPVLECLCGDIICGRTDPSFPFFTEGGSYWSNHLTAFPVSTAEGERQTPMRTRCVEEGYKSMALIPLRSAGKTIGLLHLGDKKPDRFTLDMIQFLEGIGASIGIAFSRRQYHDALKESEIKFRTLAENTSDVVARFDRDLRYLYVNPAVEKVTGRTPEAFVRKSNEEIGMPGAGIWDDRLKKVFRTGVGESYEFHYVTPQGVRYYFASLTPEYDEAGTLKTVISVAHDITELKLAENALRESEERYKTFIEKSIAGVYVVQEGLFVFLNDKAASYADYKPEELIGRESMIIVHPEDQEMVREQARKMLRGGDPAPYVFRVLAKDGQVHWIMETVTSIQYNGRNAILGNSMDITDFKRSEEEREELRMQLTQAQKMESMGRLAGGVAHDFNNMLGVILGHTEMSMMRIDPTQPLYQDLQQIENAAKRSANLTRQLLVFAHKQAVNPKIIDLNENIESMLKMLRRIIGEDIDLVWLPEDDRLLIKIDPSQVDQILANLCVNARDAIAGVGKVTIETGQVTLDEEYCANYMGFIPGDYVLLTVSDSGCGMEKEILEHIFEPFFTSKGVGQGTGLGLSTVYGIVTQNNGFINVYSEPGHGATFRIYLPRYRGEAESSLMKDQARAASKGHETVLLVEDEPAILRVAANMLEHLGYRVLSASRPGEAIRQAEAHAGKIHLLVTDVIMPEMNGRDLAKKLLTVDPNIRCLFMSGYTTHSISHHGMSDESVHFIQKPFLMKELAAKVRDVLDQK